MKKTTRLFGILLIAAMLLGLLAMTASAAPTAVSYIDANGEEKTHSSVEQMEAINDRSEAMTLTSGWYVVTQNTTINTLYIEGDVHLILMDGITLEAINGVSVLVGNSITIYGQKNQTGQLIANSNKSQRRAGIGGGYESEGGTITINGGNITAYGGSQASGIGGGDRATGNGCGDITINGGTVTAIAGSYCAGIGPGGVEVSTCKITINGGVVTAQGGESAAGIGASQSDGVGPITINGGTVVAKGGTGIGSGSNTGENVGKVTINGGHVTAKGGEGIYVNGRSNDGAGIGGGYSAELKEIEINGGYIIATATSAAGIGGGQTGSGGTIWINGGTIIATTSYQYGVGIGGGCTYYYGGDNPSDVIISGGNIVASGPQGGIGSGATVKDAGGTALSCVTYTINGVSDGTAVTDLVGITYNMKDMVVYNGKIEVYLPAGSAAVTRIYVGDGTQFCLPESEGSKTFVLHDVHTVDPVYSAHATDVEKHVETYACCGEVVAAAHTFDVAGLCLCGTQAAASVTTAGNVTTYYVDIYEAAAYAAAQDNSTMILLADVDLGTGKGLFEDIRNKVNVTLDLNGKTLSSENSHTINWNIYGHQEAHVTLTINDSVGTGKVINRKFNAVTTSTHLVINGGYFEAGIGKNTQAFAISSNSNGLSYKDTVIINGGTFHSNNGISSSSLSYVVINGGTFTGVTSVIHSAYEGQFVINGGNFPEGITTRVEWSEPIAKLLTHGVFIRDENGAIVTLTETQSKVSGAVTASKGANLETDSATVTANTSSYPYTNLEHKPTATVVIGGQTLIEGQDYTLSWSNNVNIGASAVVTATGIGDFSGSAFGTFEITKGTLKVATNPETTYEFGDVATDKAVTGGKVVIVGNESAVIPGAWAWIVPGETAQFTPDAQYIDLFEALTEAVTVTHVVTPASPVIEVVTPSPSIMPGMAIRMGVVVKNPYNGELTDLPTAFRVTYKIGENGAPVTVSGLEFTLPTTGVALGDKVYVTVENVAVSGKYAVAVSTNTIELAVGQVDYTAAINALEEQIAALKAEHGADVSELEAALEALRQQLAALNDTYATDEELAAAVQTINNTISELTNRITTLENTYATKAELEAAIDELNKAIAAGDAASAEALAAAVENLEQKLAAAVAALKQADENNRTALEAMISNAQTALEAALAALDERVTQNEEDITALRAELARLYAELKTLIESNSGDIEAINQMLQSINTVLETLATKADVAAEVAILTDLIDALASRIANNEANINANINAISTLRQTLNALASTVVAQDAALAQSISSLSAALNALEARVSQNEADIAALQAALTKAIEDLNKAIADGDAANAKALEEAVAELTRLLNEAVAKLEKADDKNKATLENMINQAKSAIVTLRNELYSIRSELLTLMTDKDAVLDGKIADLAATLEAAVAALEAADEAVKAELTAAIDAAKSALTAAIEQVAADLAATRLLLNTSMAAGDKALHNRINELTAALEAAIAAAEAADADLSAELEAAVATLNAAIDQMQQALNQAKTELTAKDAALDAKDAQLQQLVTVAIVIASVGVAGCVALVIYITVDKRRKV